MVHAMDFSETDLTAQYHSLAKRIEDIDIGVLGMYFLVQALF